MWPHILWIKGHCIGKFTSETSWSLFSFLSALVCDATTIWSVAINFLRPSKAFAAAAVLSGSARFREDVSPLVLRYDAIPCAAKFPSKKRVKYNLSVSQTDCVADSQRKQTGNLIVAAAAVVQKRSRKRTETFFFWQPERNWLINQCAHANDMYAIRASISHVIRKRKTLFLPQLSST